MVYDTELQLDDLNFLTDEGDDEAAGLNSAEVRGVNKLPNIRHRQAFTEFVLHRRTPVLSQTAAAPAPASLV